MKEAGVNVSAGKGGATMRILVVDDEPDLRLMLRVLLASEGWQVEEAASGPEALERIRRDQPELVVLDQRMPDMSGWEVAFRLIEEGFRMPLLLFSAHLDGELRRKAGELGIATIDKLDLAGLVKACRRIAARPQDAPG